MNILSVLSTVPTLYLFLILIVFVLLLIEILYIIKKKKEQTPHLTQMNTGNSVPTSPAPINTSSQTFTVATPTKKFPWRLVLPLIFILLLSVFVFIGATFLKQRAPQQELRGRAAENVSVANWTNNCGGSSSHPSDPSCQGNVAWVEVYLKNSSGSDQNVTIRKQQFSCNIGKQGTLSCGQNAQDQTYTVTVPANAQNFPLGRLQSSVPQLSVCGSAQADYFINGDNSTPYWGFAWTGSDCSVPPTHPPNATNTPIPPTATPTIPPPSATATPPAATATATPPAATATNTPSGMCVQINFYTDLTFGTKLSSGDLKNLKPGSSLVMTVLGNTNSDMARVRINGSGWQSLSQRRPAPNDNEFYDSNPNDIYQIPVGGITTFTVEGQVHDANGWH